MYSVVVLSLIWAGITTAAPPPQARRDNFAPQWTIAAMERTCNATNGSCDWQFNIKTGTGSDTPCNFTVVGSPASQGDLATPAQCGDFAITMGHQEESPVATSFAVLSVWNTTSEMIIWPSYLDTQLINGLIVVPDQTYTPQPIPSS